MTGLIYLVGLDTGRGCVIQAAVEAHAPTLGIITLESLTGPRGTQGLSSALPTGVSESPHVHTLGGRWDERELLQELLQTGGAGHPARGAVLNLPGPQLICYASPT